MMNENGLLVIDEYFVSFGGIRYCLDFIFNDNLLKEKFTNLMAEKYGEKISQEWFFKQKDLYGHTHIPLNNEPCFSKEWGLIDGIQRTLNQKQISEAINMILTVAKEMGIEVKKRNATNLPQHVEYGVPLEYQYQTILKARNNEQSNSPKR